MELATYGVVWGVAWFNPALRKLPIPRLTEPLAKQELAALIVQNDAHVGAQGEGCVGWHVEEGPPILVPLQLPQSGYPKSCGSVLTPPVLVNWP